MYIYIYIYSHIYSHIQYVYIYIYTQIYIHMLSNVTEGLFKVRSAPANMRPNAPPAEKHMI